MPPSCAPVAAKKSIDVDDDDWNVDVDTDEWWRPTIEKHDEDAVKLVANGNKVVLLLHILVYAQQAGDKVVIFANNIATLDYLEYVLALDWAEHVPSLSSMSPSVTLGRWQKAKEYVRIDGSISAGERGDLVDQFEGDVDVKAFLISRAGGIGINLVREAEKRIRQLNRFFNSNDCHDIFFANDRQRQTASLSLISISIQLWLNKPYIDCIGTVKKSQYFAILYLLRVQQKRKFMDVVSIKWVSPSV